jgi:phenylacetate-CoA ligase
MIMSFGEKIRRVGFNTLDILTGGKNQKLKDVNKAEIVSGITPEYQKRRLAAITAYASDHCPFYRKLSGITDLSLFPVMSKNDYIENFDNVMSIEYASGRDRLARYSTSGSTGTPFTVYADPEKHLHYNMNYLSFMELNGFRLGMKRGEFRAWIEGKNTISKFKSFKNNLIMMEISNMGDEAMEGVCEKIRREKIQVLVMYSTALIRLVSYIQETGYDISGWSVEMLFTMGEALPDETYRGAYEIFGLEPVRSYGNNENGFVAMTIPGFEGYVIDLYNYYVEILKMDSDEPAEEGELGRIVITDLYNRAFPMIRYDTGDTGKVKYETDEFGRYHAHFTEIYGRRGSLILNTKGEPLSIHVFMNILLNFEGQVKQIRCIQTGAREYELLVNPVGDSCDENAVAEKYRSYLGDDAVIDIKYVDEIPRLASGKTMVCENRWLEELKKKENV